MASDGSGTPPVEPEVKSAAVNEPVAIGDAEAVDGSAIGDGAAPPDLPPVAGSRWAPLLARFNPLRLMRGQTAEAQVKDGSALLEKGALAQALVAFNKALELDANCIPAYRGLARVYLRRGGRVNRETALTHYHEALRRQPLASELYALCARVYDALGKSQEATLERRKFAIARALQADPHDAVANNNMGVLFMRQGRMDDALEYFNRAVACDRAYDVAYRNLAAVYQQRAKQAADDTARADCAAKAREAMQKALEIAPTVPTLLAHARLLTAEGKLAEALTVLEQVGQSAPANPAVYLIKKQVLEGLGRHDEARAANASYQQFRQKAGAAPSASG
jgi:Tfp pilus assembly protein PilF